MPAGVPCAELGQRQCVMRKAYQRCITAAAISIFLQQAASVLMTTFVTSTAMGHVFT
jgi:hypothetical protein